MQPSLFDQPVEGPPDQAARDFAADPANHVVLEASAGTGKTRVLVDRYVRLIEAGVDPRHILALTFTRKAAAEMRERVIEQLRAGAVSNVRLAERWGTLQARLADIQISTIDAFCFALLREFPLEAGVDPRFEIADETEMARFANEALDLTMRLARRLIVDDENVRLLFARVKMPVLRRALAGLIDRRQVARAAVGEFVARKVRVASAAEAGAAFLSRLRDALQAADRTALVDDGPNGVPDFDRLRVDLEQLTAVDGAVALPVPQVSRRLRRYFLTKAGAPRQKLTKPFTADRFATADAKRRHEAAVKAVAPAIVTAVASLSSDVNGLLARGLQRLLELAIRQYESILAEHAVLDFSSMLDRAVLLLERQEDFARSRLKLQSRYHHVLVDEFQDTSRQQWRLIERLIEAWQEGEGAAEAPTSIFVVGDRKQSIYRFRDAEVRLLDEAARRIEALRPGRRVRQSIAHSFRAVPELLAFVNALAAGIRGAANLDERFEYDDRDRFPVPDIGAGARRDGEPVLGIVAERTMERCASAVAAEIARVLAEGTVRDRRTGARPVRPDDIAILFRARAGHQYFERDLEARGVRTYVYKGLGFFDAPEVQDLQALIRYLAAPESNLRAAELLRSRFVRLSDVGLARVAPHFASLVDGEPTEEMAAAIARLDHVDRRLLERTRASVPRWLALVDRVPPSELVDAVLRESAFAFEMRGRRLAQARENLKKVRTLVRRVESRGYATIGRLADYFETLRAGDESNAVIEASGCVSLMTIHAAKGLEFPIVFLVNLHVQGRGRPAGFSVIERGPDGTPEVAFEANAATALEEARDQEEARRLLYVAATRARDRLYLATVVDDQQRPRRAGRSLASLLPAALGETISQAARSQDDEVVWTTLEGSFAFRVCRSGTTAARPVATVDAPADVPPTVDLQPLEDATGLTRVTASSLLSTGVAPSSLFIPSPGDRLLGTLVHRLLPHARDDSDPAILQEIARRLARPEELVDVLDPDALAEAAARLASALRRREDLTALMTGAECHFEVPFSFRDPARPDEVIRGSIDCLVIRSDGSLAVLEFKTGRPRPEHDAQLVLYRTALEAAFPGRILSAHLVYA